MKRLFNFEFVALCLIIVTAFCNLSVFYSFYYYLGVIEIPMAWRGFLLGLEPMAAFALRLFVLPWLHVRNAYGIALVSLALMIAVSCSYLWATSVAALVVLRVCHGAVFVLLTSAVISLIVNFIPAEKSGQGFSALSVATLIPYALIPPVMESLLPHVRNAADIYAGVSVFSAAGIFLMIAVRGRILDAAGRMDAVLMRRLTIAEIRENFSRRAVALLLLALLFVFLAHATFFYFMKNLALQTGAGSVGVFFTVSMMTMIAVRVFGAAVFDKLDKLRIMMIALAVLALCLVALPGTRSFSAYTLLAAVYGGSIGVVLPLLNALLFSASAPALRGLNTNMSLFAMDAGYFLTPYLGGMLIALGANFSTLFYTAAGYTLLCLSLIVALSMNERRSIDDRKDGDQPEGDASLLGGRVQTGRR